MNNKSIFLACLSSAVKAHEKRVYESDAISDKYILETAEVFYQATMRKR